VRENLMLPTVAGRSGTRWTLDSVCEEFPRLRERLGQLGGSLSGGEQSMLAIGRALMANPRLLLMDEPSEGLAPVIVHQIGELLRRLKQEGQTILLVEQNTRLALSVADEVHLMSAGRIVFSGTPVELEARPDVIERHLGV
jgi:branched-chain amino acid transport system ATP-binding protein